MYGNIGAGISTGAVGAGIPLAAGVSMPWVIVAGFTVASIALMIGALLPKWRRSRA